MATFLDVTGLAIVADIFVFLFVWIVLWMLFQSTKFLGSNMALHAVISLILGLFVLIVPLAREIVRDVLPWIAVLIVLIVIVMMATKAAGSGMPAFGEFKFLVFLIIALVIVLFAFVKIRDKIAVPGDDGVDKEYNSALAVIFHPKVLGIFLITVVAVFTIVLMTSKVM